jgi:SPP1 family predicted phage head-tail adaptor
MRVIDAGAFDMRLTLEWAVDAPDGQGGAVRSWTAVAPVWAKLEPVSAKARELAGAAEAVVTHRVTLRRREGVAGGMRFARGERFFEIKAVHDPDESGRYLVCHCEEVRP